MPVDQSALYGLVYAERYPPTMGKSPTQQNCTFDQNSKKNGLPSLGIIFKSNMISAVYHQVKNCRSIPEGEVGEGCSGG